MNVKSVDTQAPVKAIVGVLNKHKIPIALVPSVFEAVLRDITQILFLIVLAVLVLMI